MLDPLGDVDLVPLVVDHAPCRVGNVFLPRARHCSRVARVMVAGIEVIPCGRFLCPRWFVGTVTQTPYGDIDAGRFVCVEPQLGTLDPVRTQTGQIKFKERLGRDGIPHDELCSVVITGWRASK